MEEDSSEKQEASVQCTKDAAEVAVVVASKEESTRHVYGEDSKRDGGEQYLDAVLPIQQPTSEPGLTCSGLDAGLDVEDFIDDEDRVKAAEMSARSTVEEESRNVEGATGTILEEETEAADEQQVPDKVVEAAEEKKSSTEPESTTTTTTAAATEIVSDHTPSAATGIPADQAAPEDHHHPDQLPPAAAADVAQAESAEIIPQAEVKLLPSAADQSAAALFIPITTTTAGENEQTITIDGGGAAAALPNNAQTTPGSDQANELAGAMVVSKKAPKSCVVNMASDDDQNKTGKKKDKASIKKNSLLFGDQDPSASTTEAAAAAAAAAKLPAKRGRKPGKKASESGKEATKARPSAKEAKHVQVTFDLTTQPFSDAQQLQLRAQILVYGAILQGLLPDEGFMAAAFADISSVSGLETEASSSRSLWEKAWTAAAERIHKASAIAGGTTDVPSPTAKPSKAKPIKNTNRAATANTAATPSISSMVSPFVEMASATVASWNSARAWQLSQFPLLQQVDMSSAQPLFASQFQLPLQASDPPAFPQAVSAEIKGTKRKRKERTEPLTPALTAAEAAPPSDISPATAGLLEAKTTAAENGIVTPDDDLEDHDLAHRLKSSKLKAEEAASAAATVVEKSQAVWDEIKEKRSNISAKEAQLASSFAAVTAAASVAKAAAAAANVAYAAALQARAMANELMAAEVDSDPTVIHVQTQGDEGGVMKALVSGTRDAIREQADAATFALARAENLEAVVRAAELAAEAANQAGRVFSIGNPSSLNSAEAEADQANVKGAKSFKVSGKRNARPKPSKKKKKAEESETPPARNADDARETEAEEAIERGGIGEGGGDEAVKEVDAADGEGDPSEGMVEDKQQHSRGDEIVVGSHVEIVPDEEGLQGVWFSAKIMSLDGDQALVVYDELLDDDGNGKLEEWVDVTSQIDNIPRVRIAHPMTIDGGMRKRRRAALGNQIWIKDDHVDVWMRDGWWEGIVQSVDEDESMVTVYFPGDGDTEVTKSWNLRPSLVWSDGAWIPWSERQQQNKRRKVGNGLDDSSSFKASQESSPASATTAGKKKTSGESPIKARTGAKPTKRRKFIDVIEKDQEARKQQLQSDDVKQQQQRSKASAKKVLAASPKTPSVMNLGKNKSAKKKSNVSSDVTNSDGELRKSGRTLHPTSKVGFMKMF